MKDSLLWTLNIVTTIGVMFPGTVTRIAVERIVIILWQKGDLFYNVSVVRNETFETFDIVFLISK